MDLHEAEILRSKAEEQTKCAREYAEARKRSAIARSGLLALLIPELSRIREMKKNAGIEMAILMLCETSELARELLEEEEIEEAKYKGLEKICEALQNEISYAQSIMKYQNKGEMYGG